MAPASGDRGILPGGVAQGTLETAPKEKKEEERKGWWHLELLYHLHLIFFTNPP